MIHYFSHCIVFTLFFNELILFIYIILLYFILFPFVLYCLFCPLIFYFTLPYFISLCSILFYLILFYFILFHFITFCQRYRFYFINGIISSSIIFGKYNFFSNTQLYRKCSKHWKLFRRKTYL